MVKWETQISTKQNIRRHCIQNSILFQSSITIILGSLSAALNLLGSVSFWPRKMSLMSYDLVSFVCFFFLQLLVNSLCRSHLIHIQPQFRQPKKNEGWWVALVHCTQLLPAQLTVKKLPIPKDQRHFHPHLARNFYSYLNQQWFSVVLDVETAKILASPSNMNFRVWESWRGRWPTILPYSLHINSKNAGDAVFFVEANKLFCFFRRPLSSEIMESMNCKIKYYWQHCYCIAS